MTDYDFIHQDEIAVFLIEIIHNNAFVTYSNQLSCKLLNISYPLTSHIPVELVFDQHIQERLTWILDQLNDIYTVYRFIHNFEYNSKSIPFLNRIISLCDTQKRHFLCYCHEISNENHPSYPMFENEINRQFYNATFDALFTLQLTPDDAIILVDYNNSFANYFQISQDEYKFYNLHSLISPYIEEFLRANAKSILLSGSAHTSLLQYNKPIDETKYALDVSTVPCRFLISFLPIQLQERKDLILCCAKDIAATMNTQNETSVLLEEYNALFNNTVNATIILSCKDPFHPTIIRINPTMKHLISRISCLEQFEIQKNALWRQLLKTKKTAEGLLTLDDNGNTYFFKVILVPILRNNYLERAIVTFVDTTYQVKLNIRNSARLTPREDEIVQHVISGEKNEYIAQQLCVSVGTIKRTLSNAYSKLGISSRVELLHLYHGGDHKSDPHLLL